MPAIQSARMFTKESEDNNMDSEMIKTIIAAAAVIIAAVIAAIGGIIAAKKKSNILKKKTLLPAPFPCASCNYEDVAKFHDGYLIEFDFATNERVAKTPDFVSVVYKFSPPVSLKKMKRMSFDICFLNGNYGAIDLEMKQILEKEYVSWSKSIARSDGWKNIIINLNDVTQRDVISCLSEICFVVKKESFSDANCLTGSFEIKNLSFE